MFEDLTERHLHQSDPETTTAYLTAMLGWPGAENLLHEVPDVVKEMDKPKVSATAQGALRAAMALKGLHGVKWAGEGVDE